MARPKLTNLISNLEDTAPEPAEALTEPRRETPAGDPGSAPALQSLASVPVEEPAATPAPTPAGEVTTEPNPAPAPKKRSTAKPASKAKTAKAAPVDEIDGPRYLQLTRKEARLTEEQLDGLTVLTRRLNKRRGGVGERFTDNTLIRVAVDLLLSEADTLLAGGVATTEDEIRDLLGVPATS